MDAAELLHSVRVVPVIVVDDPSIAIPLAEVLYEAGLGTIEITLRTPSALEVIENIAVKLPEVIVGAGSVRTAGQLTQVKSAGARFAVSPGSSESLLEAALKLEIPFVPGAVTASEIISLQERGYTLTKFFPAELAGGTQMLQTLGAPLPEARFFPTGGISPALAKEYLALPNVACVGGSWLTPADLLAAGDFKSIEKIARNAATRI
jgi:2-dehydro-3-deoxyphosphogluconate aldolase/(4S)-4-hydroxy-2-oxoglutarate aldolase